MILGEPELLAIKCQLPVVKFTRCKVLLCKLQVSAHCCVRPVACFVLTLVEVLWIMPESSRHCAKELAQTLSTMSTIQCVIGLQVRVTESSAQA